MLYPIYDTPTNMLFTQGAIHRTDNRTQSNIGFGWRHFSGNDWMAGVNTFIIMIYPVVIPALVLVRNTGAII